MASKSNNEGKPNLYRIPPYYYLHVLDQNTNITRVEVGPKTFIRQDHENVIYGPEKMISIPPRNYCIIENPVARDAKGDIIFEDGQVKLRHADQEIRLAKGRYVDPFALYPGEVLFGKITPLRTVPANSALRLRAVLDFSEEDGTKRTAGDEWLFEGPGTYIPQVEVEVAETIRATIIKANQALKLRARKDCVDRDGVVRVTGEEWIVSKVGAYLNGAYEEVVDVVNAFVLTDKKALHLRATKTFKDAYNQVRKNGEEWLITLKDTEAHIPSVYEEVVGIINITTITNRQYAVILDPVGADGKPQLGQKRLVKGETSFFLRPGESLERGIQSVHVLGEDEGLILRANEEFVEQVQGGANIKRSPGDRWMIRGPVEYVPPVEIEVVSKRKAIPLDANEGIYVRDTKTGKVRDIKGITYMLNENEELWQKELPAAVEQLLVSGRDPLAERSERDPPAAGKARDMTRIVTFRVPHNAAVQIYDFKEKKARVVFGPELVMLGPDEQFTKLSLSGGKPKRPNVIKALCLLLGPDFFTDIITIETADHARLQLQLSYNWHFEVDQKNTDDAAKLFSVPDFVGDACKAIASRVRGAVASVQFDDFHKNSAKIIRASVFGIDEKGKVRDKFVFPSNNLCITSIDIQSVEPVDQRTRDALQKSVQLAIEITTNSQEAAARHEAERLEQEAKGRLERQKIEAEAEAEKARRSLLELQAQSAAVESTGQAKAEAQSRAEAARIEGEAAVNQAKLKAEAMRIEAESELERLTAAREAETKYVREQNELEIVKTRDMAEIETRKFEDTVKALTPETLRSIFSAESESKVRLLQALNLQSTIFTDGNSPINLFNTANGLIGAAGAAGASGAIANK
ncbi:major vault protein [Capsaspora owczarzaki ATCC 30864]|uniref:Major vault protein n=1 Tax=Capsaspora owczarzaki (strain ATCC 30864) TaxID=595528 RepID=A0A0D2WU03_CAPO3|nr:major vault protein [Capsaspora owczarzaki ATCC 30864]KJE96050.1 major vault protein [Capsaspora owczarzaki ATCC 30864]|eukprot:XP_004345173.1 major vault protein [Capsaspora owczarzaki ATCC 30864]